MFIQFVFLLQNKFTSLSLAFKTDKLTLEKRLEIQERYRDLSEQNVEKEIKGLRSSVEVCDPIQFFFYKVGGGRRGPLLITFFSNLNLDHLEEFHTKLVKKGQIFNIQRDNPISNQSRPLTFQAE